MTGRYPGEPDDDPDSDGVFRFPVGRPTDGEVVTHWAEMPNLPGTTVQRIFGDDVRPALRAVTDL